MANSQEVNVNDKKKLGRWLGLLLAVLALPVLAQKDADRLIDRLIVQLIQTHAPSPLYQQGNNPWPGGSYSLNVFKNGEPAVSSGPSSIELQVPLRIVVAGSASNGLLNLQLDCKASFTTLGNVTLAPRTAGDTLSLKSELNLVIPPVTADCGRVQLPIDSTIKSLIAQKIPEWEARIDAEVNSLLTSAKPPAPQAK